MHGAPTAVQPEHLLAWHQHVACLDEYGLLRVVFLDLNQHVLRAGELFCLELLVNCGEQCTRHECQYTPSWLTELNSGLARGLLWVPLHWV